MRAETMPIACTLVGATLISRPARIAEMTRTSLVSHRVAGRQLCLSYRPEAAAELRAIVELERACCALWSSMSRTGTPRSC